MPTIHCLITFHQSTNSIGTLIFHMTTTHVLVCAPSWHRNSWAFCLDSCAPIPQQQCRMLLSATEIARYKSATTQHYWLHALCVGAHRRYDWVIHYVVVVVALVAVVSHAEPTPFNTRMVFPKYKHASTRSALSQAREHFEREHIYFSIFYIHRKHTRKRNEFPTIE